MTATVLFYIFALLSAASAVGVVVSRNIVRTAVFLLFTLLGVGGLYFLLSAEFLAAVQLVVYAGGTLILIIFGVMLTSKSPFSRFGPKAGEVVVALSMGFAALNAGQRVTLRLGFLTLYRVPLTAVAFGALILGMLVMLLASIHSDLKVRRILTERLAEETRAEPPGLSDDRQRDLFEA